MVFSGPPPVPRTLRNSRIVLGARIGVLTPFDAPRGRYGRRARAPEPCHIQPRPGGPERPRARDPPRLTMRAVRDAAERERWLRRQERVRPVAAEPPVDSPGQESHDNEPQREQVDHGKDDSRKRSQCRCGAKADPKVVAPAPELAQEHFLKRLGVSVVHVVAAGRPRPVGRRSRRAAGRIQRPHRCRGRCRSPSGVRNPIAGPPCCRCPASRRPAGRPRGSAAGRTVAAPMCQGEWRLHEAPTAPTTRSSGREPRRPTRPTPVRSRDRRRRTRSVACRPADAATLRSAETRPPGDSITRAPARRATLADSSVEPWSTTMISEAPTGIGWLRIFWKRGTARGAGHRSGRG